MREELKMAREVYITEARANLAREAYWINKSTSLGFPPEPLPPAMLQLPILTATEYRPNLGGASDDEDDERLLVFYLLYLLTIECTPYKILISYSPSPAGNPECH